ncbi:glucose-1-phosphate thymidylyltransferase RfbA [Bacteroidetes bacterium endosymbiont of Geopemphigus sp.]|uniref:glucose-1-phosphate thymidylyltransferase RfbA n=1 Tax=Bacteroidetes bacterium endosymbiont of Geopemphigus sp. TaxID=2047937 RepID=UPI000CD1A1F9|nr:glucose-1-phosphate thymidylyltransferase RfbA [Bacteroidetes bacterium endosymbiont of Geopemphigus sp.]
MRGIVLAGGSGTRLYPLTVAVSKQLMPVYDKPMIYYPLSTLMLAGVCEILIITTPKDQESFQKLLGDGSAIGCHFSYKIQRKPNGLADAFILGEDFIGKDSVALILGDNIFYGSGIGKLLRSKINPEGGTIFAYRVKDPRQYGVVEFNSLGNAISLQEKPQNPRSNYAVPGLYFYDNSVIEIAKNIQPSARGELEITSVNSVYLKKRTLQVGIMDRGIAWLDIGTFDSLLGAGQFIEVIEKRQGFKIGCIEEVAYRMGYITIDKLTKLAQRHKKSSYGTYLEAIVENN